MRDHVWSQLMCALFFFIEKKVFSKVILFGFYQYTTGENKQMLHAYRSITSPHKLWSCLIFKVKKREEIF